MTILVTGATGNVGRQAVDQLAKRGADVCRTVEQGDLIPGAGDVDRLTKLLDRPLRTYRDFAAEIAV